MLSSMANSNQELNYFYSLSQEKQPQLTTWYYAFYAQSIYIFFFWFPDLYLKSSLSFFKVN